MQELKLKECDRIKGENINLNSGLLLMDLVELMCEVENELNDLNVQDSEKQDNVNDNNKYYISVDGKKAPSKVHDSLESAEKETKRLANKEIDKEVMILQHVKSYKSKVVVEEL
jgi:hypothetical protein